MIQITPHMRILVAVKPVDFRRGIDGLAGLCRNILKEDPFSGCLFVFCNRRRTSIKILVYDGAGFWLCQKRLSRGKLNWWPDCGDDTLNEIHARLLQQLIWNDASGPGRVTSSWRRIKPSGARAAA